MSKNFKEIVVTLKGPVALIAIIDQKPLEASFDFSDFNYQPGSEATFEIVAKIINLPVGVEVISSDPKTAIFNF